jgi:hypothetical protein
MPIFYGGTLNERDATFIVLVVVLRPRLFLVVHPKLPPLAFLPNSQASAEGKMSSEALQFGHFQKFTIHW